MLRFFSARTALVLAVLASVLVGCQKQPPVVPPAPQVSPADTAATRLAAGKRLVAAGKCSGAMADLSEAARLDEASAEARLYLGICAARTGDLPRAREALTRAAALDAKDPRPLEALGIAFYEAGRREDAMAQLDAAVARGSTNAQVWYYRGNLFMTAGDCDKGLAAYRKAMTLDPTFTPAITEYKNARVACARVDKPAGTPAPKRDARPKAKPRPTPPAGSRPAPGKTPAATAAAAVTGP